MLWTFGIILLVLWALGMATSYTAGGLIHILLVIGLIVLVFRLIQDAGFLVRRVHASRRRLGSGLLLHNRESKRKCL